MRGRVLHVQQLGDRARRTGQARMARDVGHHLAVDQHAAPVAQRLQV